MRLDWRTVSGPFAAAALAVAIFVIDRWVVAVPEAAALCIGAVALSAAVGGIGSGLASAAISILFTALLLMPSDAPPLAGPQFARLIVVCVAAPAIASIIGLMQSKLTGAIARERERRMRLEQLSGALDEMDIGVVLLDTDTRAQFINRAFREMFRLSEQQARNKPPFVALMYHGRDIHAYEMPEAELGSYISTRIAQVRSGDPTPIDLKLTDGQVLRFRCAALPDGGRMLTYMPITDLIRRSDNPADRDMLLAQRAGRGNADWMMRHAARTLGAAE
ncbi:PAS-domain containing protein [Bradyrhizobium prioriisuperbiae]|uniref:PAS-domain containing protein n=1 Tax=Bradyrhizobium prioriisuperbiae TaxID=2854389 RepID=UPI0028E5B3EB|nr:PAS-domain containing protein [Bradyrhizobium prioritasuperba]